MKKIAAILLAAALMTMTFAGCGTKTTTETGSTTSATGSYADLTMLENVQLGEEKYGIAFRTGSDMVAKVDAISADLFSDGTIAKIAGTYDKADSLIAEFKASTDTKPTGESDWEYIKKKGTMVIGITDFKPMDYKDTDGNWIGFDAEYAQAVCEKLGVKAEFLEIEWNNKELSLSTKVIDCIWNGMTITPAILEAADVTGAYMENYQVVIVKDAKTFTTLESLKGKTVVAESGSAGETAAQADENLKIGFKAVESQSDALLQVESGAADACVIDFVMAKTMLNK